MKYFTIFMLNEKNEECSVHVTFKETLYYVEPNQNLN